VIVHATNRLRRAGRQLANRFKPRALILLYHRIATLDSDPWILGVAPHHFAEHLEVLRRYSHPMRLQDLTLALERNQLPKQSVVITFDDGYADNLYNAKPTLERYDIPATIFLPTGSIGREREFWWDELDRIFLQPGTLPETLDLTISERKYRWKLDRAAHYSRETSLSCRHWRAWEDAPSSRHSLYSSLWQLLHVVTEKERDRVMNQLLDWAGMRPMCRPSHRSLTLEEVFALAEEELIELGAHTVTHPVLSSLPEAAQRHEILMSKRRLQDLLNRPVSSFS
jgi:peptidoglycan/xylan/chitin deacetylase (PgdA/CDA1 family)